jgi:hypothetical protein
VIGLGRIPLFYGFYNSSRELEKAKKKVIKEL